MKIFTFLIPALFQVILRAQEVDISDTPISSDSIQPESTSSELVQELESGNVTLWIEFAWSSLWKQDDSLEDVSMEERREWIADTLEEVMIEMKHKHATPEMMVYKTLSFEDNRAIVEFPGLKGYTQMQLEVIIQNLFKAEAISTIGGAFVGDVKLDLWGLEAEKQMRQEERVEKRKARKAAGDIGFEKEMQFTEEELFEHLRKEKEMQAENGDRLEKRTRSKERWQSK